MGFEGYSETSSITSVRKPKSFLEKTQRKQRETEQLIKPKEKAQNPKRNYTQKPVERERDTK